MNKEEIKVMAKVIEVIDCARELEKITLGVLPLSA